MSNEARIAIVTPDSGPISGATRQCVLGRDITIDPQALQDYCASMLRDVEHDLVVLCGAVIFADRTVSRRRGSGWSRNLDVTIPVRALDAWTSSTISTALTEVLDYVTGDHWHFNFVEGGARVTVGQSTFGFENGPYVVIPFSDGLDSFLQWQLLKIEEPELVPLRIQTSSRAMNEKRNRRIEAAGNARDRCLRLPVSASVGSHAEPTYRTRTFLFFCMAALAAAKSKAGRVVVGENGVGALGPSLIQYGNECPHRTTHPAFTRRLGVFINALLGTNIVLEHLQLYRTKGQILSHALSLGVTGWENTNSCVRNQRDRLDGLPCGVCSGCLLRRTALVASGCDPGGFFWESLSSASLDGSKSRASGRDATDNDRDIMRHGAHAMDQLSALAKLGARDEIFLRAAWELTGPVQQGLEDVATRLHGLVVAHADEWSALRAFYGEAKLLNLEAVS